MSFDLYKEASTVLVVAAHMSATEDVDARLLTPVALLVLRAVGDYLRHFYPGMEAADYMLGRITDLESRITKADAAHEAWMQQRKPRAESTSGG